MDLFNDVTAVWELRGSFPDIPHFPEVDIVELTKGDSDPFYLTIPIGEVGALSGNGRYYDAEWITELEKQVRATRPVGIMGHLKPDNAFDFPPEAIHWVGVTRINEMLWGKGYMPPGEARERVRRYKATNTKMGTSIYAEAKGVFDKAVGGLKMLAETMKLHQIDIGPASKIGISSLAMVPIVTAEMEDTNDKEQDETMDKLQVIRELTADDAGILPEPVRAAVLSTAPEVPEVALVAELREVLGDDPLKVVKEWKEAREKQAQTAVGDRIAELVADPETGIKIESARPIVMELVKAKSPQTAEEAEAAYKEVSASPMVTEMLKAQVVSAGGPPLLTGLQGQQSSGVDEYFPLPPKQKEGA